MMKYPESYERGYQDEETTLQAITERGESLAEYKMVAMKDCRQQIDWWKKRIPEIKQSGQFVEVRTQVAHDNIAYFSGRLLRLDELL